MVTSRDAGNKRHQTRQNWRYETLVTSCPAQANSVVTSAGNKPSGPVTRIDTGAVDASGPRTDRNSVGAGDWSGQRDIADLARSGRRNPPAAATSSANRNASASSTAAWSAVPR